MTSDDWLKARRIREHEPSAEEIRDLLALARRDLADCRIAGLSPDWRLGIAYNAAMQLATAALAAAGYRAAREVHHYRVLQSLACTIGADDSRTALLDQVRKKRNQAEYERAGLASRQEAEETARLAQELFDDVMSW